MGAARSSVKYYLSFIGPLLLVAGWSSGAVLGKMGTLLLYEVAVPVLDWIIGSTGEGSAPARERENERKRSREDAIWFQLPLYLWAVAHCGTLFWMARLARDLLWFEAVWLGFATGLVTCVSVAVAHELLHKLSFAHRSLAAVLLVSVMFGHYRIAHTEHHRRVATEEDFSTARKNETPYTFVPRSLLGGLIESYKAEKARLSTANCSVLSASNEFVRNWILSLLLLITVYVTFGLRGAVAFLVQAAVAVSVHEMTSYVEHYGLRRKKLQHGRYEKVALHHSWVAPQRLTNYLTFNVQIHPDHHMRKSLLPVFEIPFYPSDEILVARICFLQTL